MEVLNAQRGKIALETMMQTLRDHGTTDPNWTPGLGLTDFTVCAHGGFGPIRSTGSTGSMVSHLASEVQTHFVTLERELYRSWQNLDITVAEGIDELGSLRGVEITIGDVACQKVPRPVGLSEKLLQAAGVRLPEVLPLRQTHVATRKNLTDERKRKQHRKLTPIISQN